MTDPIRFTLDGVEVEAAPGETIWQAAQRVGTEIPHLCWLPKPGYRADGNCRACMVEVEGERVLAASCIRRPSPGMKVHSASERAKASRKLVFELLVGDHAEKIVFDFDDPMGRSTCVACGECVQACPTGALMPATLVDENGVFTNAPEREVDSVCPYCGVGCQLTYQIKDDHIVAVKGKD